MILSTLTIAEQERLAYIEGYTDAARLLARLDDCHAALAQAAIDYEDLEYENQTLKAELTIATGGAC